MNYRIISTPTLCTEVCGSNTRPLSPSTSLNPGKNRVPDWIVIDTYNIYMNVKFPAGISHRSYTCFPRGESMPMLILEYYNYCTTNVRTGWHL